MKIVNVLGGLGNQMFEYAMYLALRHAHPEEEIKICTRSFRGYKLHNGIEIERIFGQHAEEATLWELAKLAYPFFNFQTWRIMHHLLPKRKTMVAGTEQIPFNEDEITRNESLYYDGYWQNEKNFKHIRDIVLNTYTFPEILDQKNKELAEKIKTCNAVSCHVRRGDFINHGLLHSATPGYYYNAITYIMQHTHADMFVIFSDDIQWCEDNLKEFIGNVNTVYVDWNKGNESYRDMQLMSMCKYNIIANSSFSWWGAWLNTHEEKIVVVPEKWYKCPIKNDPICDDWIRISE